MHKHRELGAGLLPSGGTKVPSLSFSPVVVCRRSIYLWHGHEGAPSCCEKPGTDSNNKDVDVDAMMALVLLFVQFQSG